MQIPYVGKVLTKLADVAVNRGIRHSRPPSIHCEPDSFRVVTATTEEEKKEFSNIFFKALIDGTVMQMFGKAIKKGKKPFGLNLLDQPLLDLVSQKINISQRFATAVETTIGPELASQETSVVKNSLGKIMGGFDFAVNNRDMHIDGLALDPVLTVKAVRKKLVLQMAEHIGQIAQQRNCSTISCIVNGQASGLIKLYESIGFKIVQSGDICKMEVSVVDFLIRLHQFKTV